MEAIFEIVLVLTGSGLVRMLSFGRWRGESLTGNEGQVHAAAGALSFVLGERRVVTTAGLTLIGMAFYGLLLAAGIFLAARG
ncbi:hypothetical protein [Variovorax sp. LT1R16]|uniref:hypothetical protein n=1 Tax=Variovorax sp. LT1R16 TaxID=3443728 RepID=UPI003F44EDC1